MSEHDLIFHSTLLNLALSHTQKGQQGHTHTNGDIQRHQTSQMLDEKKLEMRITNYGRVLQAEGLT